MERFRTTLCVLHTFPCPALNYGMLGRVVRNKMYNFSVGQKWKNSMRIFNAFQEEKWVVGATHKLWFCSFFKTQENAFLMIISLPVLCLRPSSLIPQLSAYGHARG